MQYYRNELYIHAYNRNENKIVKETSYKPVVKHKRYRNNCTRKPRFETAGRRASFKHRSYTTADIRAVAPRRPGTLGHTGKTVPTTRMMTRRRRVSRGFRCSRTAFGTHTATLVKLGHNIVPIKSVPK